MSSFQLKILACVTMLIDHIGWIFFPQINILRVIGRLSFPIFAFLIAEGSIKTHNINSYINRLLVFGLISQIPYSFAVYLTKDFQGLNIFFTLAAGLFLIKLIQKKQYFFFGLALILFTYINLVINYDYGIYGLLLIIFFYVFLKNKIVGSVLIILLNVLESVIPPITNFEFRNQIFSILALIPIILYKGVLGRKISRWYFYIFYPLHLAILSLVFLLS